MNGELKPLLHVLYMYVYNMYKVAVEHEFNILIAFNQVK